MSLNDLHLFLKKFQRVGECCTQHVYRTAQAHTEFFYLGMTEFTLSLC